MAIRYTQSRPLSKKTLGIGNFKRRRQIAVGICHPTLNPDPSGVRLLLYCKRLAHDTVDRKTGESPTSFEIEVITSGTQRDASYGLVR